MPQRLCLTPTCPDPATFRGRCQRHAKERNREINRAGTKIYATKRWAMTRRRKLFDTPLCEHPDCDKLATDVHHRIDLAAGGDPWAQDNLESLCHSHHSKLTRQEQMA